MNNNFIRLTTTEHKEVNQHLRDGKPIRAIKIVKNSNKQKYGLREAKQAIDRYRSENFDDTREFAPTAMKLICGPQILSVTLDYGDGPIELDLEGMQLKALSELHTIGLEACGDLLQMVDIFTAMTDGKNIQIIEE